MGCSEGAVKTNMDASGLEDADAMMAWEVHEGLTKRQKTLSPKFFYDKKGSELFDAITKLNEYYPTRIEISLLQQHIAELTQLLGKNSILFELGSGSSIKIRLLLDAIRPKVYIPMDISLDHLMDSVAQLAQEFPWLNINAQHVDYSRPWNISDHGAGRRNAFFPGSSIGNFEPNAALALLEQIASVVGHDGGFLIGVDLKKDKAILEAAYNDEQAITAEFNLNMLAHINYRLNANFDFESFSHRAIYNAEKGRIEMHLVSLRNQQVLINGETYSFNVGETIHTENSYKYTVEEFHQLAARAGFSPVKVWTDNESLYSLHYLVRE